MNLSNYIVKDTVPATDTIQIMYENQLPIIICENKKHKITGIFTEGDFRKAIYKGLDLKKPISKIMNRNFKFLKENYNLKDLENIFAKKNTVYVPVIKKGKVIKIVSRNNIFFTNKKKNKKLYKNPVVIIAGGKGTRLRPFTNILPKPLIPIKNKSALELVIENFLKYGANKIELTLGDKGKMIEAYLSNNLLPVSINYYYEKKPLGSAGSLGHFKNKFKKSFFVTNCDVVINADYGQIMEYHLKNKDALTIVGTLENFKVPYGVCKIDNKGRLLSFVEKPSYHNLASTGFYVFSAQVLKLIKKNKFLDMNELINNVLKKNLKISVYPIAKNNWYDLGQWQEYYNNSLKIKL